MSKTTPANSDLRYPIGRFPRPLIRGTGTPATPAQELAPLSAADIDECIRQVEAAPGALRAVVSDLSEAQLDTPYRDGGWTVRQLVHRIADSHLHGYVRFKLALTEETPAIVPYAEARWAELPEAKCAPADTSLALLDALHARWVAALRAMTPAQFERTFFHPEYDAEIVLSDALALYAWHGRHHVAHVAALRDREGWG